MIAFIASVVQGVLGFLQSFLPDSPFQQLIENMQMIQTGIGWLNWCFPVNQAILVFTGWLAACVVVVGAKLALRTFSHGFTILNAKDIIGG